MTKIMGFNLDKIPLVKNAIQLDSKKKVSIFFNRKIVNLEELDKISIKTIPPPGWVDNL